jgi:F-type H+-transporting ATPase subunit delta
VTQTALAAGRRFARALLDVAEGQASSTLVDTDLSSVSSLLEQNEELRRALSHPGIPSEKKKALARALFGKASPLVGRLLDLLIDRDRIALLPAITSSFHAQWNARRGVVSAEAISAVVLEPAQRKALEEALSKTAEREVELKASTDPSVLGGILVKMGGRSYDGTVRSHLKALRHALAGGGGY